MNAFFDELATAFEAEAKRKNITIAAPRLDSNTADELLKLASVVAHTKERRFAPLACYVAGLAAARAQQQNGALDVVEFIKGIRLRYEPQEDSSGKAG